MNSIFARSASLLALVLVSGCATGHTLKMTSDTVETVNGKEVETAVTPSCVFQAGNEKSTTDELLIFIKITNKSEKPFDFDPTTLRMSANRDVIKNSPLIAKNPETYSKELLASAENFEQRTKMESYQGIDELVNLNAGKSDREIEAAKRQAETRQKESEKAKATAEDLRARAAMIQTNALKKSTVKPGASIEGPVVFKSEFESHGIVHLSIPEGHPCASEVKFIVARPSSMNPF